jgi:hypothetical protein
MDLYNQWLKNMGKRKGGNRIYSAMSRQNYNTRKRLEMRKELEEGWVGYFSSNQREKGLDLLRRISKAGMGIRFLKRTLPRIAMYYLNNQSYEKAASGLKLSERAVRSVYSKLDKL